MSKYAITIGEKTMDLIRVLNNGGEVAEEEDGQSSVFLCDIKDGVVENQEIKLEKDLYDESGHSDPDINWMI